ncbi:MAG: SDR family NAD(P)-dependent oxidoreductase, partial [Oligoflexales bacterium]|nr:SDR family NAD(P)-dependent oxidoreductase [Oligoflexales bacterium]
DEKRVGKVRPDVRYHLLELDQIVFSDPLGAGEFLRTLVYETDTSFYPVKIYKHADVDKAFRLMSSARHIGKIVIKNNFTIENTAGNLSEKLSGKGSYLVTGGFGNLGLKICAFLVSKGAGRVILAGRKEPSGVLRRYVDTMKKDGSDIELSVCDITKEAQLKKTLARIVKEGYPIKGVIHAAGVRGEGHIANTGIKHFREVFAPKIKGTLNLLKVLSLEEIDFFISFSSVLSLIGSPGESAYVSANSFLDALPSSLENHGHKFITINWGPWAGGGMAREFSGSRFAQRVLPPISPLFGRYILDSSPSFKRRRLTFAFADWQELGHFLPETVSSFFLERVLAGKSRGGELEKESANFLERIKNASLDDRRTIIESELKTILANILGLRSKDEVSSEVSFIDLGLDSLMALDMIKSVESRVGRTISPTMIYSCKNVNELTNYIMSSYLAESSASSHLVELAKSSISDIRVYLVPDFSGTYQRFQGLVGALRERVSVYGFKAFDFLDKEKSGLSIRDIIEYYANGILSHSPKGKIPVIGWSLGGFMAYEVACYLEERSYDVSLHLIDSKWAFLDDYSDFKSEPVMAFWFLLQMKRQFGIEGDFRLTEAFMERDFETLILRKGRQMGVFSDLVTDEIVLAHWRVFKSIGNAFIEYAPSIFNGEMFLYVPDTYYKYNESVEEIPQKYKDFLFQLHDGRMVSWERCAKGSIKVVTSSGDHFSMIENPYSAGLVSRIVENLKNTIEPLANKKVSKPTDQVIGGTGGCMPSQIQFAKKDRSASM